HPGPPGERQIRCNRRLADASLARGNGHDVLDLLDRLQVALNRVSADIGLQLHFEWGGQPHRSDVLEQGLPELFSIVSYRISQGEARDKTTIRPRQDLAHRV